MRIQQIFDFIKDRCGDENEKYVLVQINAIVKRLWHKSDIPGSLRDVVLQQVDERIMVLPWYVDKILGVKRFGGAEVTLYTPRVAYQDNFWRQDLLQWVMMDKTPLLRPFTNVGPVRARLKRAETTPLTLTLVGPTNFGSRDVYDLTFVGADREKTTSGTMIDVTSITKSRITTSDIEFFDCTDTLIGVLPAERLDVQNHKIRLIDACTMNVSLTCNRFIVLYKPYPPEYTSSNESIDDQFGDVVQNLVAAEMLAKSKDDKDARRMAYHGRMALDIQQALMKKENEGKSMKVNTGRDGFTHEFYGHL